MSQERTNYLPVEAQGLTEEMVRDVLTSKSFGSKKWTHFTPEFVGTKIQELDVSKVRQQITASQHLFTEARIGQEEGNIVLPSDLPLSIFFIGDVHYGSIYTDHDAFHKTIDKIMETPNAYVVFMANMIDNGMPAQFPNNMLANAIPPDKQVVTMRKIARELNDKDKLLGAVTAPCHEGWTYKHTGQDLNALIYGFPERKFPVLENGGLLNLNVNGAKYVGALYHQVGPFESNFNETHALRQLNRLQKGMKCDFIAGAHRHFSAAEMVYEGDGKGAHPVAYIRTGTFKGIGEIRDQWLVGKYGSTGELSGQSVILWPKEKRMECFLEFDTGIMALEAHYLRTLVKLNGTQT